MQVEWLGKARVPAAFWRVYRGITKDPKRREQEHKQRWQNGRLVIVGRRKTEESARKWQASQLDLITLLRASE